MNTITGYLITATLSLFGGIILERLKPTSKLVAWFPHNSRFTLKDVDVTLQTNLLTLQNLGRKPAENVELVHRQRPDHFQFHPAIRYVEDTGPDDSHILRIESLGAKEFVTLQLLSYKTAPEILSIRSKDGPAKTINVRLQRMYPKAVDLAIKALTVFGGVTLLYWAVRSGVFLYENSARLLG